MNLKDLLTAPRYGIYLPKAKTTTDVEYTGYGSSFRVSTSLELGDEDTFGKVKTTLNEYLDKSKVYFEDNDMALLGVLLGAAAKGASYIIDFGKEGITLASLITVDAKKISFIYEKYNYFDYAIQLSLTQGSSIKFAWADSKLTGDFYFNLKRSVKEDITTITGYTQFHLGNEKGAKPVVLSAGVVNRVPLKKPSDAQNTGTKSEKVNHTYIRLQSRSSNGLTIADIVRMITPDSIEIPDALDNVAIYDFAILTKDDKAAAATELAIVLDCKITISEKELNTKLTIISKKEKKEEQTNHTFKFHGVVSVDEHRFDIDFTKQDKIWSILASYANRKTVTIDFKKLASSLFGAGDDFPDLKLDIAQPKVFFYYQKTTNSESGESKGKLLMGMGAGIDLKLQDLPIAGSVLVEMNALKFKEVIAIYANEAFTEADLNPLTDIGLVPKKFVASKGVSISAEVVINGSSEYYTLGGGSAPKPAPQLSDTNTTRGLAEGETPSDKPPKIDPSVASQAKWLVIDKKLGPVNLQRLGLAYHEGKIITLLDASIEMKGMTLQMMGLGVGFKLDWSNLDPDFYLYGLGLSYKTDSVEISGAFLRGSQEGIETYNGAARLKMKAFTISAIGSYAQMNDGKHSLFIYGLFEGNIGGPPEFYVTGIAAGFGYNRKVNAPELMDIATYPLVALAMQPDDTDIGDVLKSLEKPMSNGKLPIEISQGNYWLALGVKFTTYKLLESFVLITVNFGIKTEFNVLGLSRLNWPEKSLRDKVNLKDPIVFVELAIRVSFGPDSDVIKVEGMITPNSYVLSKDCKLTGGFALYTWLSGEHAGDFVLTIGGYHPRFPKPAHYPTVPRVGLNWKMGEYLMLRGELYFALTSSAIMMGGRWELIFNTDIVKAAFILWIDLLIEWAPFYYDLNIGIIIRIEAHIPLKLITIHLSLEIRAQLQIWGPPFSGVAEIDLGIFSFEIRFGNKELPNKEPLRWNDFAEGFLPKENPKAVPRGSVGEMDCATSSPTVPVNCIAATVSAGVINIIEKPGQAKLYIANPMQMAIAIDSTIPVTKLLFNDSLHHNETPSLSKLGVKPCGYKSEDMDFEMKVSMKLGNDQVDTTYIETKEISKGFPDALWGVASDTTDKNPKTPEILRGLSGINIRIKAPEPHYLQEFDFSKFLQPYTHLKNDVNLSTLADEEGFDNLKVYNKMKSYQDRASTRNGIIEALKDLHIGFGTNDEFEKLSSVQDIYQDGQMFFRATPKLCRIGHKTHNHEDTI